LQLCNYDIDAEAEDVRVQMCSGLWAGSEHVRY
jgi:hypothetical protein